MRFYKLRVTPHAAAIASTFNEQFKPEIITSDPKRIEWFDSTIQDKVIVGEDVSTHVSVYTCSALTVHRLFD
jgi:actin-related protein 8